MQFKAEECVIETGIGEEKKTELTHINSAQSIDRHKYTDFTVSLCIEIYLRCNCGFRKASAMFGYLNELLGWGSKDPVPIR
jgi:hypothetical protein